MLSLKSFYEFEHIDNNSNQSISSGYEVIADVAQDFVSASVDLSINHIDMSMILTDFSAAYDFLPESYGSSMLSDNNVVGFQPDYIYIY